MITSRQPLPLLDHATRSAIADGCEQLLAQTEARLCQTEAQLDLTRQQRDAALFDLRDAEKALGRMLERLDLVEETLTLLRKKEAQTRQDNEAMLRDLDNLTEAMNKIHALATK